MPPGTSASCADAECGDIMGVAGFRGGISVYCVHIVTVFDSGFSDQGLGRRYKELYACERLCVPCSELQPW